MFGNPRWIPPEPGAKDEQEEPNTRNNATQSYIQAGYRARGNAAYAAASRLLRDVRVQARCSELRKMEQRIASVFLSNWKTLLAEAQDVLRRAMAGEEVSTQAVQAAREVIDQAEGPSRFRFGIDKGADQDGGLNITLWAGKNRGDDE